MAPFFGGLATSRQGIDKIFAGTDAVGPAFGDRADCQRVCSSLMNSQSPAHERHIIQL